jgi:hypothetical protein
MKLLVTGDSWTYGSELRSPELKKEDLDTHKNNTEYRTKNAWPHKLSKLMGNVDEMVNISKPSASNDRIVRELIDYLTKNYIKDKKPVDDLFVIVGFSSLDRVDFFYDGLFGRGWETIWPKFNHHYRFSDIEDFSKLYNEGFSTIYGDFNRYVNQIQFLELFFEKHHIKYMFFHGFYHHQNKYISNWEDVLYVNGLAYESGTYYSKLHNEFDLDRWIDIDPIRFVDKDKPIHSFHNRIKKIANDQDISLDKIFAKNIGMHPSELGHTLWAEYLYEYMKENKKLFKFIEKTLI